MSIEYSYIINILFAILCLFSGVMIYVILLNSVKKRDFLLNTIHLDSKIKISVIIPARNEGHIILSLIDLLKKQTLVPDEIIVVSDNSSDDTFEKAKQAGVNVINITDKPSDWIGKSWALTAGAKEAKNDTLIFMDADVIPYTNTVSSLFSLYSKKGGIISLQPFHTPKNFIETLSAIFNIVALTSLVGGSKGLFGPCIMLSKNDYLLLGGHEKIKNSIVDDIALGNLYANNGYSVSADSGKNICSYRMYHDGFNSIVEGWSKNISHGAQNTKLSLRIIIVLWICGLIMSFIPPMFILKNNSNYFFTLSIIQLILFYIFHSFLFGILASKAIKLKWWQIFLFPVYIIFFVYIYAMANWNRYIRKTVIWKGRKINVKSK